MERQSLGRDAYFQKVVKDESRRKVLEVYCLPMCGRSKLISRSWLMEPWCLLTPRFFYSNDGRYSVHNERYKFQFLELDKAFKFIAERYCRHEIHIEESAYDCLVRWNRDDLLSRIKGTFYAGYFGRPEG